MVDAGEACVVPGAPGRAIWVHRVSADGRPGMGPKETACELGNVADVMEGSGQREGPSTGPPKREAPCGAEAGAPRAGVPRLPASTQSPRVTSLCPGSSTSLPPSPPNPLGRGSRGGPGAYPQLLGLHQMSRRKPLQSHTGRS